MQKDEIEKIKKEAIREFVRTRGEKGASAKWAKYPPGSVERLGQIAPAIDARKRNAKRRREEKGLDS